MASGQRYEARAEGHPHPVSRRLLSLMAKKKSNLCLSADVTTKAALLRIVKLCAPFIVIVKTHIDIISDFDHDLTEQLRRICDKEDVLIFEDRKFADIGNTVQLQYTRGIHEIASWADIVNAHALPGDGIIQGLRDAAQGARPNRDRACLLIAELSSRGSLAVGEYTKEVVKMAKRYPDFVFGFIAGRRVQDGLGEDGQDDFLVMTPGVGLHSAGDGKGQQYRTPEDVIVGSGSDIIIVGRGIYGGGDGASDDKIVQEAQRYRDAGWAAYEKRLK